MSVRAGLALPQLGQAVAQITASDVVACAPAAAAHTPYALERSTILRWEQWQPILMRIAKYDRTKESYERLGCPEDLRWLI